MDVTLSAFDLAIADTQRCSRVTTGFLQSPSDPLSFSAFAIHSVEIDGCHLFSFRSVILTLWFIGQILNIGFYRSPLFLGKFSSLWP
jgi:hypothetical protein